MKENNFGKKEIIDYYFKWAIPGVKKKSMFIWHQYFMNNNEVKHVQY